MTTLQWTGVNQVTNFTVASWRAWGLELSNAFTTLGLTKTSDTGQIDWATVALPGASVYGGYEIRQFTDSITSYPMYLRFDYGTSSSGGAYTKIQVQVGFATNGAGGITGPSLTSICEQAYGGNVGVPVWSMCMTEGIFWFTMVGQTGADGAMVLERRVDQATGALINGRDIRLATYTYFNNASYQCLNYSTNLVRSANIWGAANLVWQGQGSGMSGGDVRVAHTYAAYPEIEVCDSHLFYRTGEITTLSTPSATVFSARTYMATNQKWHSATASHAYFMGVWA